MEELNRMLQQVQATDKPSRVAAEQWLTATIAAAPTTALTQLIQFASTAGVDPSCASQAALRFKNYLLHDLDELTALDTAPMKAALLAALPQVSAPLRRLLLAGVEVLVRDDSWPELVPALLDVLEAGTTPEIAHAALQTIYVAIKKFKLVFSASAEEQEAVSSRLLPVMPRYVTQNLYLAHIGLKIFETLILTEQPKTLNDRSVITAWVTFMLGFSAGSRPAYNLACPQYREYMLSMKRIARVSVNLLQSSTRLKKKKKTVLASVFMEMASVDFADMWYSWLGSVLQLSIPERQEHRKINVAALKYLRECAAVEPLYRAVEGKAGWDVVAKTVFFPFLAFAPEDVDLWEGDAVEFLRQLMDPNDDQTQCRAVATKGIMALCSGKKGHTKAAAHLASFSTFLQEVLTAGAGNATVGDATDSALFALGVMKPVLKKLPPGAMESVLCSYVAPQLQSQESALRAKAVWLCGLYAGVPFQNPQQYAQMLEAVIGLINDPVKLVRMQVVASSAGFLAVEQAAPYMRQILIPMVEECLRLVQDVNNEYAVLTLTVIVESFGPELSQYLTRIGETLIQNFRAARHELQSADLQAADDRHAHMNGMAALHTMGALKELIAAMHFQPEGIATLVVPLSQMVCEVVSADDEDLMDVALTVASGMIMVGREHVARQPAVWALFEACYNNVMNGNGVDFFEHHVAVLDNLMSFATDMFLQEAVLEKFLHMYRKILSKEVFATPGDVKAAPQLLSSIYQYAKAVRPAFDAASPAFLRETMQALAYKNDFGVRACLCVAVLDALYYDAAGTLQALDSMNATGHFLTSFVAFFHEHRARYFAKPLAGKTVALGMTAFATFAVTTGRPDAAGAADAMAVALQAVSANASVAQAALTQGLLGGDDAPEGDYDSDDSVDAANAEGAEGEAETGLGESEAVEGFDGFDEEDLTIETPLNSVNEAAELVAALQQLSAGADVAQLLSKTGTTPADVQQRLAQAQEVIAAFAKAQTDLIAQARDIHNTRAAAAQ